MIGKIFSADIAALYKHIKDNQTEWGYRIEYSRNCDNEYYDLRGYNSPILICDGEMCEVTDCFDNCVRVVCKETDSNASITFSKEEFDIVCRV